MCSIVPFFQGQYGVERLWRMRSFWVTTDITVDWKWGPPLEMRHSVLLNDAIHFANDSTGVSLSGFLWNSRQIQEVKSSFNMRTFLKLDSLPCPMYKKFMCITSFRCCPWSVVANGQGIRSPDFAMMHCRQLWTNSSTSSYDCLQ